MSQERDWPAEKIHSHYMTTIHETVFLVKWKGYDLDRREFGPLENLVNIPLLVKKYVASCRKSRMNKLKNAYNGDIFTRPPSAITRALRNLGDFVPNGSEKVRKIYAEVNGQDMDSFYLVTFFRSHEKILVRRSLMHYFFPLDSIIFIKKRMNRKERVSHQLRSSIP